MRRGRARARGGGGGGGRERESEEEGGEEEEEGERARETASDGARARAAAAAARGAAHLPVDGARLRKWSSSRVRVLGLGLVAAPAVDLGVPREPASRRPRSRQPLPPCASTTRASSAGVVGPPPCAAAAAAAAHDRLAAPAPAARPSVDGSKKTRAATRAGPARRDATGARSICSNRRGPASRARGLDAWQPGRGKAARACAREKEGRGASLGKRERERACAGGEGAGRRARGGAANVPPPTWGRVARGRGGGVDERQRISRRNSSTAPRIVARAARRREVAEEARGRAHGHGAPPRARRAAAAGERRGLLGKLAVRAPPPPRPRCAPTACRCSALRAAPAGIRLVGDHRSGLAPPPSRATIASDDQSMTLSALPPLLGPAPSGACAAAEGTRARAAEIPRAR